ncbi:MAG: recombinase family protein [Deltaproteobacteria bacterium]|nr:recombinase family protein [Deltaproteobacteria bacterium]
MGRQARRNADPHRAIGYVRVSTDEQTLGPEAQRAALERWCQANAADLVAVFVEQGVSGAAPLDKRPQLLAALAALREHGAGVLLVAKRDRLARDTMVAAMVERVAERHGAVVRTADGISDGDGPESVLMRRIVDAFAEYERLVIKARTRAALAVKKARGERVGDVPYGWRVGSDGIRLEAEPAEQRVLEVARVRRAQGLSLRAIGACLEAAGARSRSGGRWHPQTVANVLRAQRAPAATRQSPVGA